MRVEENPILTGGIPEPERLSLQAGPLSLEFEPATGFVRYVRLGDRELLRGIYAAVRDANWDTIEPRVSSFQADLQPDAFTLTFHVACRRDPVHFTWQGRLTGEADGTLTYHFAGTAVSTFQKNRIGFCVLHPAASGGRPVRVEHVDGTVERSEFPAAISPDPPFLSIRGFRESLRPSGEVEVRLEGDTFEMEDQRNWTDASFKTFCTPLSEPFPVEIAAGTRIEQTIRLRLIEVPHASTAQPRDEIARLQSIAWKSRPLPSIGLGLASHGQPLSEREIRLIRELRPAHLRVDLRLNEPDWPQTLGLALGQSTALDTALELALFVSDAAERELTALADRLRVVQPRLARCFVFHVAERATSRRWMKLARDLLLPEFPKMLVGGGSNANFTELNRGHTPWTWDGCVSFAINPQVHAFDNASLVETLPIQGAAVQSARKLFPYARVAVSPVTLRPRFNAVATGPEPPAPPSELPWPVDPRQVSLFAAGWTLASLKYLAESHADSLTYYETTGWRGVMETERGSPLPERFFSAPGALFPVYHVLAACLEWPGAHLLPTRATQPLHLDGLVLQDPQTERLRALVANLTGQPRETEVEFPNGYASVRYLDETTATASEGPLFKHMGEAGQPVTDGTLRLQLRPYAVACIDSQE